ncbi:hypothetical protein ACEXQD_04585 [Herbiconiux sp. P15]|uniref:hypothetical protein n=1 Tax=Herbiconiux liukaitaii TaxID=3342799 RepID=UPI0035B8ACAD
MNRHRVIIDVEFSVDEDQFKAHQLTGHATGVSDVTDPGLRDAIAQLIIQADWADQGLEPLRSLVTTCTVGLPFGAVDEPGSSMRNPAAPT